MGLETEGLADPFGGLVSDRLLHLAPRPELPTAIGTDDQRSIVAGIVDGDSSAAVDALDRLYSICHARLPFLIQLAENSVLAPPQIDRAP